MKFVPVRGSTTTGSVVAELSVLKRRDLQLALATTAVGNAGVLTAFTYLAPLLTDVSGFATETVPALLLVYGIGATAGNLVGGRLSDRALLPSTIGLLGTLTGALLVVWLLSRFPLPSAVMLFIIGALAFSIIPGMQTRVLITASAAPTLGIALNASGFQIAAAFAAWLGGQVIDSGLGLRSIYLVSAFVTTIGVFVAFVSWLRDRSVEPSGA